VTSVDQFKRFCYGKCQPS